MENRNSLTRYMRIKKGKKSIAGKKRKK